MYMRKIVVFCASLVFLASCKSKENSSSDVDSNASGQELKVFKGKVVDDKRKSVEYAAVKLYLDDDDCMSAYTDAEGRFEFSVDELRVKDQSHFEIVYKGYSINMLSLRNFKENQSIKLSKKGDVIPTAEYHVFYEDIKNCNN